MNNELTTMHEIAMEFVDEARLAKKRGDHHTTRLFFQKALNLEKMVALGVPKGNDYQLTRSVFFRSAASIALNCACYPETIQLVELALASNPHSAILPELEELTALAQKQQSLAEQRKEITGRLIAADLPNHQIKIQVDQNNEFLSIKVPEQLLPQIVKSYWEEMITVESIIYADGSAFLQEVKLAA